MGGERWLFNLLLLWINRSKLTISIYVTQGFSVLLLNRRLWVDGKCWSGSFSSVRCQINSGKRRNCSDVSVRCSIRDNSLGLTNLSKQNRQVAQVKKFMNLQLKANPKEIIILKPSRIRWHKGQAQIFAFAHAIGVKKQMGKCPPLPGILEQNLS